MYRNKKIILPVLGYGCKYGYRLKVFKNRILKRIIGPKRDEYEK